MNAKSVAIVTGASQGIGKATALRLAGDFSALVLAARDEENLAATAAEVRSTGAEATVLAVDLRQPESADIVVNSALQSFGRVDALLNIAGAVPQFDLFEMSDAQWDDGMALKLHGARRLTIRAWEALKGSKGSVVFISGSAALDPKPGFAAVAATNAAIIAIAKAFAEQGIKDGVQVNSVVPGAVMTGRRQSFFEKWAPAHNLTRRRSNQKIPRGSRHQPLRKTRGNCRPPGLPRLPRGEVADRSVRAHGRRRDQRRLAVLAQKRKSAKYRGSAVFSSREIEEASK